MYYCVNLVKFRKPELIIRENEPMELPPDVVRGILVKRCAWMLLHFFCWHFWLFSLFNKRTVRITFSVWTDVRPLAVHRISVFFTVWILRFRCFDIFAVSVCLHNREFLVCNSNPILRSFSVYQWQTFGLQCNHNI